MHVALRRGSKEQRGKGQVPEGKEMRKETERTWKWEKRKRKPIKETQETIHTLRTVFALG